LIGGTGIGLDATVLEVIEHFNIAVGELKRVRGSTGAETTREENIVGFTMWAEREREALELLGVVIEDIEPGSPLDLGAHRVVEELSTDDPLRLNTVARCLTPRFSWQATQFVERQVHAKVAAFTTLAEISSTDSFKDGVVHARSF
jgi:hypothetical protein